MVIIRPYEPTDIEAMAELMSVLGYPTGWPCNSNLIVSNQA
jgi:hypothetical protein